jgi:hypothetical protein
MKQNIVTSGVGQEYLLRENDMVRFSYSPGVCIVLYDQSYRLSRRQVQRIFRYGYGHFRKWTFRLRSDRLSIGCEVFDRDEIAILRRWAGATRRSRAR